MGVKYSKKRIVGQSTTKSLKYMQPLAPGTVLTITDVLQDTFKSKNAQGEEIDVMNDNLLCVNEEGITVKIPVREYNKMKLTGKAYNSESDDDDITMPNQIIISGSTDRTYKDSNDVVQKLYPTFAYEKAQEFLDSKGGMKWEDLIASGEKEGHPYAPVQNYEGEVK